MDMETALQSQVIKFATQAHIRFLIIGIVCGVGGFIGLCFGVGLYHRPVLDEEGSHALDENEEPMYENTFLGSTILTAGIVMMVLALYCFGSGFLARLLQSATKKKRIRRLQMIYGCWTVLSLVIAALLVLSIIFTGNFHPALLLAIGCGLLVSLWRLGIIFQLIRECKDTDYKY